MELTEFASGYLCHSPLLPALLSEPKRLPSLILFELWCLPLSFPSGLWAVLRFAVHGLSAKMGPVKRPRCLAHCIVPDPRLPFPFIQLKPKVRRGQLCLCGVPEIGCVLASGRSKVRDTEMGTKCHIFCFSVPDIIGPFLTHTVLIQPAESHEYYVLASFVEELCHAVVAHWGRATNALLFLPLMRPFTQSFFCSWIVFRTSFNFPWNTKMPNKTVI